jgi:hypothetical protein
MPPPLQCDLEKRILDGLACEYRQALSCLEAPLRRRLAPPLLRICELKGHWGQWVPERREIRLSRRLVTEYPWGAVRDVLRHEMAHQLAGLMDAGDSRPHGAAFRQACRLLRADPAASAAYRPLDLQAVPASRTPEDRLRRRVQKLFALCESPNPHEAASAMRKARELIARHGVHQSSGDWAEPYISILLGQPALRHFRDDYLLAHLLTDLYAVAGVWVPAYVLEKARMGSALEVSGRPAEVQVAAYAHDVIRRVIQDGWCRQRELKRRGQRSRRDFAVGVIEGFRGQPLAPVAAPGPSAPASRDLVAAPDPGLDAYVQQRYPGLRRSLRGAGGLDAAAYGAGLDQGRRLVIRKGITGGDFSVDTQPAIAYLSR